MKQMERAAFLGTLSSLLLAQEPMPAVPGKEDPPKRLPDGTLQSEAILKEDHKRLIEDAAKLVAVAKEIEEDVQKNAHHVLSIALLKKLDEAEKIAKRMRGRHRR